MLTFASFVITYNIQIIYIRKIVDKDLKFGKDCL